MATVMQKIKDIEDELLDLPGIIEGAKDGKGRGRQVISTARTCNCILIVLDAIKPITHKRLIEKELEGFGISAHLEWNLDGLLEKIWEYLSLTRIYTKPKGMNPDYEDPVILSSKGTVGDFCTRIHKDMLKQFKYALVWGSSAKHKPQRVGKEHELEDEDAVQIIKKVRG